MGYNDQFIPLEEKVFPIPEEAFADANMPTDPEAMAWVNINVPMDNRNGSLAVYNRPGDEVSTTTFAFIWMVVENPTLNIIRIKDINTSGTKWFFGSGAPNPVLGVPNDFYYRTSNCDILNKHITLGWQIVGNAKGIQGDVGPSPQMQVADGKIQWKRDNIITWYDLISLAELIGPPGPTGSAGADGKEVELNNDGTYIRWRYVGNPSWVNLVPLSSLIGPQGVSGTSGKEIELGNDGTYIRWRYVGESWSNLVALSSLKGQQGDPGPAGATGPAGMALTVNHSNTTMEWNSFNFFEDADSITSVSIVTSLGVAPGSLLGVNNTRTSGNITISPGVYSLVGYASSPFTLTPGHGVVFVYLGINKITIFSIY